MWQLEVSFPGMRAILCKAQQSKCNVYLQSIAMCMYCSVCGYDWCGPRMALTESGPRVAACKGPRVAACL